MKAKKTMPKKKGKASKGMLSARRDNDIAQPRVARKRTK